MTIASNRHDVYGIQVFDKRDSQLPDVGLLRVEDLESGVMRWVDTSSSKVRKIYNKWWYDRQLSMSETLRKSGVDFVSIPTDEDYVSYLMGLFKKRVAR